MKDLMEVKDIIKKRTPSDAIPVLRWAVMIFTLLTTTLVFWAATGKRFSDEILLPSVVVAYGAADFSYSILSIILYRERKRRESEEKNKNAGNGKFPPSYGEIVGTVFVALLFLIGALAGFEIWKFKIMPDAAFVAIDITVGIIVAASIVKNILLPKVLRKRHNKALYFLSVYSTAIILLLFTRDSLGLSGPLMADDYLWSYGFILAGYVTHNIILSILRPGIPQKRRGELVALGVIIFTVALYSLNALDILLLPRFITPFFVITIFILGIGAGAKFMLKDLLRRMIFGTIDENSIKKHLEDEHIIEGMEECKDCNEE